MLTNVALSDKILMVLQVASKSHHILGKALAIALAKKGHDVTVMTTFPSGKQMPNYTEVYYDEPVEFKEGKYRKPQHYESTNERESNQHEVRSYIMSKFYVKYYDILTNIPTYLYRKIKFRMDVHNIYIRRKDVLSIPVFKH